MMKLKPLIPMPADKLKCLLQSAKNELKLVTDPAEKQRFITEAEQKGPGNTYDLTTEDGDEFLITIYFVKRKLSAGGS